MELDEIINLVNKKFNNKTYNMTRQEANRKIIDFLNEKELLHEVFTNTLEELIEKWPNQRFGQIICNYACPDYREAEVNSTTKLVMGVLFKNFKYDPFYEESIETLERLQKEYV